MLKNPSAELFPWADTYRVGIEEIDSQHLELVRLLNELHHAIVEHQPWSSASKTLKHLAHYAETHFAAEERLMQASDYPDLDIHHRLHETLLRQVNSLQEKLELGVLPVNFELLGFLKRWLFEHINGDDKEFARFYLRQEKFVHAGQTPARFLATHDS